MSLHNLHKVLNEWSADEILADIARTKRQARLLWLITAAVGVCFVLAVQR